MLSRHEYDVGIAHAIVDRLASANVGIEADYPGFARRTQPSTNSLSFLVNVLSLHTTVD